MSYYTNPHDYQCPWYPYSELFGPSNQSWCEETMCHWISEPINTYTNISYILMAIALYFIVKKSANSQLRKLPYLLFGIGIASTAYHASNNYLSQVVDFIFIFLFMFWATALNFSATQRIKPTQFTKLVTTLTALFTILVHVLYINFITFQPLVGLAFFIYLYSEYRAYLYTKKESLTYHCRYLVCAIGLLIIGQVFSFLDVQKIMCVPTDHFFQGHALWHILSAISLALIITHRFANSTKKEVIQKIDDAPQKREDSEDIEYFEETFSDSEKSQSTENSEQLELRFKDLKDKDNE